MVRSRPAIIGGEKLSANLRPDLDRIGLAARRDFRITAHPAMQNEISASPIQMASQRSWVAWRPASKAVIIAVIPIATPPQPGTAVNAEAPSIVSRINRRLSIARVCRAGGSSRSARIGRTEPMSLRITGKRPRVKYFARQRDGVPVLSHSSGVGADFQACF